MKGWQIVKQGVLATDMKISTLPVPTPDKSQLLVRNTLVGLNFIDTYYRSGLYKKETPFVLGQEGVGIIEKIGSDVDPKYFNCASLDELKGCRVGYLSPGSYAEYTTVPYETAFLVPEDIPDETAVASIVQGRTAHYLTHSLYRLKPNDWCLVHAAAGGTGQVIVQLAKVLGAKVIGTCSTNKIQLARQVGCDHVIDYSNQQQPISTLVKQLTNGLGVQIVYDGVGKATYEQSLNSVAKRGIVCFFGNASGPVPPIDPLTLSQKGSIFITRPTLVDYLLTTAEREQRNTDLFNYVRNKQLVFTVDSTFPFTEAAKAHQYMEAGQTVGKVLLNV